MAKRLRVNQNIKAPTVRLIGEDGEQLGIMGLEKAMALAKEKDLDLAEVAGNANPPVCKIIDYGKHQYHQKKVETKHRKSQKKTTVKGIRMGFKTGDHDIDIKVKQARKFLEAGNGVKVTLIFKGREIIYKNLAIEKMKKFYEKLEDIANMEAEPKANGYTLNMMLTPIK
ncbi:translation initiation factor IF-3 [Candidatus Peregrinibacteria bacterium]|nr:translation initiation factor IF-3 [Candidatus Peregrinibacteria bacterium]